MKKSDNPFNCPSKIWDRFSKLQKRVYIQMREASNDQSVISPMTKIPQDKWETICHNMACNATWIVSNLS